MFRDLSQWKGLTVLNTQRLWNSYERLLNVYGTVLERFWNGFGTVKQTIQVSGYLKDKVFTQSAFV
jgi:hypothetical protein